MNRWDRSYRGAVNLDGVGNRVTHCELHDGGGLLLLIHGNDHLVEFNEVYNAVLEGHDMGAIYLGRDPSEAGIVIRYNIIHHIGNHLSEFYRNGLYLDDYSCGVGSRGISFTNA